MHVNDVRKMLRQAGWRQTMASPKNVVDYQTSTPFYNRIILYPEQVDKLTEEALRELMGTRSTSEERVKVMRKYSL